MDTGSDFIRPEFLNIIFFQQKNLVIFPYVDIKHLHTLEIFAAGFNIVDLESTALHNLREILEFEKDNSYSQNPTLFFITNVSKNKIREIMSLVHIRCIINSNETSNFRDLVNNDSFIFFNKKHNQFLNYNLSDFELQFEENLISSSKNSAILQDKIQKIKSIATTIFTELNQNGNLNNLHEILAEYNKNYWRQILEFTSKYYDIKIPKIDFNTFPHEKLTNKLLKDFSKEYEICISTNKQIGKEFIQLLHEYRSKRVNSSHLELEELYNPRKLYNYLRNHHWNEGIPEDFISAWARMEISGYKLIDEDQADFNIILTKISNAQDLHVILPFKQEISEDKSQVLTIQNEKIPILSNKGDELEQQILNQIDKLEYIIDNFIDTTSNRITNPTLSSLTIFLIREISDLRSLFKN
ncbi:MAG: hypothetical protein ACFE9Q_17690 [Candidatus Hodarchaeota archaeon]